MRSTDFSLSKPPKKCSFSNLDLVDVIKDIIKIDEIDFGFSSRYIIRRINFLEVSLFFLLTIFDSC